MPLSEAQADVLVTLQRTVDDKFGWSPIPKRRTGEFTTEQLAEAKVKALIKAGWAKKNTRTVDAINIFTGKTDRIVLLRVPGEVETVFTTRVDQSDPDRGNVKDAKGEDVLHEAEVDHSFELAFYPGQPGIMKWDKKGANRLGYGWPKSEIADPAEGAAP